MEISVNETFERSNTAIIATKDAVFNIREKDGSLAMVIVWISPTTGKTIIENVTLKLEEEQNEANQKDG